MRILFVSDFHHLNKYPQVESGYKSVFNQMDNSLITLKNILLNNDYDLLVIGGDLCEDGEVEDYRSVKDTLDKYNHKPYLITLGNHDIKENFFKVFTQFKKTNKLHYTKDFKQYKLISFDSSVHNNSNGYISSDDQKWLLEEINNSDKEIILLTHHHLLDYQHDTKSVKIDKELLKAILDKPIKLVLTNHTHTPFFQKFNYTTLVNSGSLSFRAHSSLNNLIFDNETYYTIIEVNDYIQVNNVNLKKQYQIFRKFDLNNELL